MEFSNSTSTWSLSHLNLYFECEVHVKIFTREFGKTKHLHVHSHKNKLHGMLKIFEN